MADDPTTFAAYMPDMNDAEQDIMNFAHAFHYVGARYILVSLWNVPAEAIDLHRKDVALFF